LHCYFPFLFISPIYKNGIFKGFSRKNYRKNGLNNNYEPIEPKISAFVIPLSFEKNKFRAEPQTEYRKGAFL